MEDEMSPEILPKLGAALKAYRKKAGMTQEQLAYASNLDRSYIARVEGGKVNISIITLCDLCQVLGTDIKTIILQAYENCN